MTSACACTTIYNIYNVHALLVLYFCSQSVKDRVSCPPFSESECKGTAFFWTGKTIQQFFSRKMRKKTRWDKKKGIMKRNFILSDRNWMLRCLAVGNLNNGILRIFVRRFADLETAYYLCSLVGACFFSRRATIVSLRGCKKIVQWLRIQFSYLLQ